MLSRAYLQAPTPAACRRFAARCEPLGAAVWQAAASDELSAASLLPTFRMPTPPSTDHAPNLRPNLERGRGIEIIRLSG